MRNHSYENDFDLHENETAYGAHFNVKGFALRLVLKQRHKRTRKWPIVLVCDYIFSNSSILFSNSDFCTQLCTMKTLKSDNNA